MEKGNDMSAPKARRYWLTQGPEEPFKHTAKITGLLWNEKINERYKPVRVFVIRERDLEAMAYNGAAAFLQAEHGGSNWKPNGSGVGCGKAFLAAIGLTRKKPTLGKLSGRCPKCDKRLTECECHRKGKR